MSAQDLLDLVAVGHKLLAQERVLFMRAQYAAAAELALEKQTLLDRIEQTMRGLRATPALTAALKALIEDSRHNERVIQAARAGVAIARRKIAAIIATQRGAVAYDREGRRINSTADAMGKTRRA